ncbi:MAG: cardiolipin synthase [Candidatus Saccharibacteria bacterium]|nr:cardiolipin synthase [Candidatus Saccharibacteria bacterium]
MLAASDKSIKSAVEAATGSRHRPGNSFTILKDGEQIFPAMLEDVRRAEHSIEFLSFVFWRSRVASEFATALIDRAKAGVKVRLLVDAVGGASISARTIWELEKAGVQVGWFRPGRWKYLSRFNHRTHRKLLIVDARIGFTGGVGIADEWIQWRETHCRVEGPAVADMHAGFADSWYESVGDRLGPVDPAPKAGNIDVHTTISTAGTRPTQAELLVTAICAAATRRLWISSAYFVPSPDVISMLSAAAVRKVDVRILTNGPKTNHRITRAAGRAFYQSLLDAGVKIYEYQPTLHHSKVMTADNTWATIGSTNIDPRSLVLNDELNVSVSNNKLVDQLDEQFIADLEHSILITPEDWAARSRFDRLAESAASLFAAQL